MKGSLQEATRELRTFTYLLHPPALQREGLSGTLGRYVEEFGRRTGLETSLQLDYGVDALPLPLQRSILRIVQEALANVHRHASASSVSVNLERKARELHLVISDDGRGIAEAPGNGDGEPFRLGVGIQGMTARVQQFGGNVEIKSELRRHHGSRHGAHRVTPLARVSLLSVTPGRRGRRWRACRPSRGPGRRSGARRRRSACR